MATIEFAALARAMERDGFLLNVQEVTATVCLCTPSRRGWAAAATEVARQVKGQVLLTGNNGLRWGVGSRLGGYLIDAAAWPDIDAARSLASALVDVEGVYTVGGVCRRLWKYVNLREHKQKAMERLCPPPAQGQPQSYLYNDCKPGSYENVTMYDLSAFFYTLLSRLETFYPVLTPTGVDFLPMTDGERGRWRDVLELTRPVHKVRNSLWGAALGGTIAQTVYTSAKPANLDVWQARFGLWHTGRVRRELITNNVGIARPAGLLVARTSAEVCQLASMETDSVYSVVDCITTDGPPPRLWDSLGLPYGVKTDKQGRAAQGAADIQGVGCWRIGNAQTLPYGYTTDMLKRNPSAYNPMQATAAPRELPDKLYYREWL